MATPSERIETGIQTLILLLIGGMAGAASFTHVHDWTIHNSPSGTGDWFGWANAIISELTPTAAGLEIRRRKRNKRSVAYPMAVLIAAAALSISAQLAVAKPGPTGWLLSAVPALAFLALSKLVLSSSTPQPKEDPSCAASATTPPPAPTASPAAETPPTSAAANANTPAPSDNNYDIPGHLLTGARIAAFTHRQTTGHPITPDALADQLGIPHTTADTILHTLGEPGAPTDTVSPLTTVNGTPTGGGRA